VFSPAQYTALAALALAHGAAKLHENAAVLVPAHRLIGLFSVLQNVKAADRKKSQIICLRWCPKYIACVSGRHYN
jgi:hypothetical protein